MSSMCSAVLREQLADLDPALAVLPELERRGERRAGLPLGAAGCAGIGLPAYFASAGLGSNVSTCDGPPFMKKWIDAAAPCAGKWGGFTAMGSPAAPTSARAPCSARSPPERQRAEAEPGALQEGPSAQEERIEAGVTHRDSPVF